VVDSSISFSESLVDSSISFSEFIVDSSVSFSETIAESSILFPLTALSGLHQLFGIIPVEDGSTGGMYT
jgi:hypothetical protein